MDLEYRIISIGALSRHELWDEQGPVRTAHATCTLVRAGDRAILVDPGLPGPVIAARLQERSGLRPEQVTDVFLTNFRPAHRWGLDAFAKARWAISEMERETVGRQLVESFQAEEDEEKKKLFREEIALMQKMQAAPDRLAPGVDLFPLPGFTPGTCGLLLCPPNATILIAGDAVATKEHFDHGRVLKGGYDAEQARESLRECIEIADVIIPGHDNLQINPTRRPM